jgi:hypothetical protein
MKLKDILPPAPHNIKFYVEDYIYSHIFYEYPYEYLKDIKISENAIIEGDGDLWFMDIHEYAPGKLEIITIIKVRSGNYEKSN